VGGTHLGRGGIAMPLEQPVLVEPLLELEQWLPEFLEVAPSDRTVTGRR